MTRKSVPPVVIYWLWFAFLVAMVCAFRAVSSISTGLLVLTGLWTIKDNPPSQRRSLNAILISSACFYFLQAIIYVCTSPIAGLPDYLQTRSAMVFVPLAVATTCDRKGLPLRLLQSFTWIVTAALLFCIVHAVIAVIGWHGLLNNFLYHQLVSPFQQHAVQVSIFVFVVLLFLLEQALMGTWMVNRGVHYLLIIFLVGCMLLLSSKLLIASTTIWILYYGWLSIKSRRQLSVMIVSAIVIVIAAALITNNLISKRFTEIVHSNFHLQRQSSFSPGVYFDGLQFRLLQWRFVKEILTEQGAWWTGVSAHAQQLLNDKYIAVHMFTGDGTGAGRGYLGYNTHNEFLQALLESGLVGLCAFIAIIIAMFNVAWRTGSRLLWMIVILLVAYCFNESVLETQYGATLFGFFPLLFYYYMRRNAERSAGSTVKRMVAASY